MTAPAGATTFVADAVLAPDAWLAPGWVRVVGDRIAGLGPGRPADASDPAERRAGQVRLPPGTVLAPGFVDMHAHGGGGASFTSGDPEQARRVLAAHRARGTTSMMASLVTQAPDVLAADVAALAPLVRSGELVGIHLEGPCLSPAHRGAHDPSLLTAPTPAAIDAVLEAGDGAVRMVTLATELDGGLEAVGRLVSAGVVAALGHTDATYDQTRRALDAGVGVATHLCNAMRPLHHREPGPILALTTAECATLEVIADGVHLHPAVVAAVFAAAPGRVALVTDAMSAAGAGDGDYRLGPLAVRVENGVARVRSTGAIAGSTLTLDRAVAFAVREAGVGLEAALRAATQVPAARLGRTDVGVLAPGARADLVGVGPDASLRLVVAGGRVLPQPD
ncbi:N-acetylglucosamine-6-phosphate deacetylase [Agilicoccus flavus]|uniref:N-acetylglucosamine-6-phosphate deacetylase n=1 Tax=Agilicoccus flavus TaxID=2775968 RepID=UPI001CF6DB35|nr:N-acetylglucosamine-6-phosphate deacetylase [Agilicoccus flavus]